MIGEEADTVVGPMFFLIYKTDSGDKHNNTSRFDKSGRGPL